MELKIIETSRKHA